jgi:hypothetical protein
LPLQLGKQGCLPYEVEVRMRWLSGVALGLASLLAAEARAQAPPWRTDYAAARAEARRTGKPLFVVFRCVP